MAAKNNNPFHSDEAANASFSRNGSSLIVNTDAYLGNWCALQVVTDAVLDATGGHCACTFLDGLAGLNGITLPAGTIIYGNWTKVTLTSGIVIMHNTMEA